MDQKKTVKRLIVLASVLAMLLVATLAAGAFVLLDTGPAVDPQAEYYRGMYDACAAMTRQPARCLKTIEQSRDNDWYGQPSPGWQWPLGSAGSAPLPAVSPAVPTGAL